MVKESGNIYIGLYYFILINEPLWVLVSMTFATEGHCLIPAHNPGMGLMAVKAVKTIFHMKPMLSNDSLILVAFTGARSRIGIYLLVWFVTLMALQTGHRTFAINIAVTFDAPVFRNHRWCLF